MVQTLMKNTHSTKNQIAYISHGGGPMPLLGDAGHQDMINTLQEIARQTGKPDAVLVVSAHWEASRPTVSSTLKPQLIYDYGGFPSEAYKIQYPCPGEPALANAVHKALSNAGIKADVDPKRGLDHGAFVPLKIMYPEADIPVVQLSLTRSLDAEMHLSVGKALQNLDYQNLLVLGSGMSFHNLPAFFAPDSIEANNKNRAFEDWLTQVISSPSLSQWERHQHLKNWQRAPHARFCHPREEHLLPLHLCYGLAQRSCDITYTAVILGKQSSMFVWQASTIP